MNMKSDYRRMYPDLPEPVYEPLKFTRHRSQREMIRRAKDWYEECDRNTNQPYHP